LSCPCLPHRLEASESPRNSMGQHGHGADSWRYLATAWREPQDIEPEKTIEEIIQKMLIPRGGLTLCKKHRFSRVRVQITSGTDARLNAPSCNSRKPD
jgi:hypothetical protein